MLSYQAKKDSKDGSDAMRRYPALASFLQKVYEQCLNEWTERTAKYMNYFLAACTLAGPKKPRSFLEYGEIKLVLVLFPR